MPESVPVQSRLLALMLLVCLGLADCNRDPQVRKQKFYNHGIDLLQKGKPERPRSNSVTR